MEIQLTDLYEKFQTNYWVFILIIILIYCKTFQNSTNHTSDEFANHKNGS